MLILALLGAAIFISMRRSLMAEFDAVSLAEAHTLASMTEQHGQHIRFDSDQPLPEFNSPHRPEYFELRLEDGSQVARSSSLGSNHLAAIAATNPPTSADTVLPDGRRGRLLSLRFTPQADGEDEDENGGPGIAARAAIVVVARDSAPLDATLSRLRWLLLTLVGSAVCLSDLVLVVVVNGALRPMRRVAQEIESFPEDNLSRRLNSQGVPAELAPVVERLNGLLGRLEAAFARERSFTADVAHELRTPLAGLQTTLEVCRSKPRDPETYQSTIDKCLAMAAGIRSMVQTLLTLARADAGQLPLVCAAVNLSELIEECWRGFQQRAAERGLHVEMRLAACGIVQRDAELLKIVMNNLFDNAVSHADEGGSVWIRSTSDGVGCTVEVANTGSRVVAGDSAQLFRRFWRGDESRSATGLHCGLGLSLCQRLLSLTGDDISASSLNGVFSIRLVIAHRPPSST
jgi:two-component system sensor histidine kinase QseC